jgi:hypothetical protein
MRTGPPIWHTPIGDGITGRSGWLIPLQAVQATADAAGIATLNLVPGPYLLTMQGDDGPLGTTVDVADLASANLAPLLGVNAVSAYSDLQLMIQALTAGTTAGLFVDTAEGLAATDPGAIFMVPSGGGIGIYQHQAGGVAGLLSTVLGPVAEVAALAFGGATRAQATGGGLTVTGLLSGTAVMQSLTDATAGRLMPVGAFGLGGGATTAAHNVIDNIDDPAPGSGIYATTDTTTGTFPFWAGPQKFGQMIRVKYSNGNYFDVWQGVFSDDLFVRRYRSSDGGLQPWRRLIGNHNIVGTVTQTAGLPMGAVIETGTNANGTYTRFADGTQVCRRSLAASAGAAVTWTFPAAFAAAPAVVGTAQATVLSAVCLDGAPTTTACTFSARDKTDARRADTCHLVAHGRWF